MRALVVIAPGVVSIEDVPNPKPESDEVVVRVERAGVCGTDLEFVKGTQPYLQDGGASYPMRIGHEWAGVVDRVGNSVNAHWIGRRVTADTMLGCQLCTVCLAGRQHLCPNRTEIGVLRGRPGALADEIAVPLHSVRALPTDMPAGIGALVEPASLAYRCIAEANVAPGGELAVLGTGTIGLLCIGLAARMGIQAHAIARSARHFELAAALGAAGAWQESSLPSLRGRFDAAVSVSPDPRYPAQGESIVRAAGVVVLAGISGAPSALESRNLVVRDIRVQGLLSGSPTFDASIPALHALGGLAEQIIGAAVTLEAMAGLLMTGFGELAAPKIQAAL